MYFSKKKIRALLWAERGWFVTNRAMIDGPGDQIAVHQLDGTAEPDCNNERGESAAPGLVLSGSYSHRPSLAEEFESSLLRQFALHAFSANRARLVMQTGIMDPSTTDDSLLALDICRESDGRGGRGRLSICGRAGTQIERSPATAPRPVSSGRAIHSRDPAEVYLHAGRGWEGAPKFSPDGNWLAFLATSPDEAKRRVPGALRANMESDESLPRDLWIVRNFPVLADLGQPGVSVNLTRAVDSSVREFDWGCNSRCLLLKFRKHGRSVIRQIDYRSTQDGPDGIDVEAWGRMQTEVADAGDAVITLTRGRIVEFAVTASGRTAYLVVGDMREPIDQLHRCSRSRVGAGNGFLCEMVRFEPDVQLPPPTPSPAGDIEVVDIGLLEAPRKFLARAETDDSRIENLQGRMFLPRCYFKQSGSKPCEAGQERIPLLFHVHGGPHGTTTEGFNFWLHRYLNPRGDAANEGIEDTARNGFVLVAPDPAGSAGYGERYRADTVKSWGGQAYLDVLRTIEYFAHRDGQGRTEFGRSRRGEQIDYDSRVDFERIFVFGQSYGGYIVNLLSVGHGFPSTVQLPEITALASVFGVSDTYAYPCETDQLWFPLRQFGYNELNCAEGQSVHYLSEHDPLHYLLPRGTLAAGGLPCLEGQSRSTRCSPLLLIHGTKDRRVRIGESQKMAAAMAKGRPGAVAPFRACEVSNGEHGFVDPIWNDVYRATVDWFSCAAAGARLKNSEQCALISESNTGEPVGSGTLARRVDCRPDVVQRWVSTGRRLLSARP